MISFVTTIALNTLFSFSGRLSTLDAIVVAHDRFHFWLVVCVVGNVSQLGRFDTKLFRYKSIRYKLKSFRDIMKVDSMRVESRFDSTQSLCSQPFSGLTSAKTAIPVSQ